MLEFGTYGESGSFVPRAHIRSTAAADGSGLLEARGSTRPGSLSLLAPARVLHARSRRIPQLSADNVSLAPAGGMVGVGTTMPEAALDVAGSGIIRGNASVGGTNDSAVVSIASGGTATAGLQLGPPAPAPGTNGSADSSRSFGARSRAVTALRTQPYSRAHLPSAHLRRRPCARPRGGRRVQFDGR